MTFKEKSFSERLISLIENLQDFNNNNATEYNLIGSKKTLNLIEDDELPSGVKKVPISENGEFVFNDDKIFILPVIKYEKRFVLRIGD